MRPPTAALLFTLCLLLTLPTQANTEGNATSLPPTECVKQLREARLAGMDGDPAKELELLQATAEAFPQEIAPVYRLLEYHRHFGLPEAEHQKVDALFASRLRDNSRPSSLGLLEYIVRDTDSTSAQLAEIRAHLERRVAVEEPEPNALRLLVSLERRLENQEAAVAHMERLWKLTGQEVLLFSLIDLYVELKRWEELPPLLKPRLESSADLLSLYLRTLARLGRLEELEHQIDLITAQDENVYENRPWIHGSLVSAAWILYDAGNNSGAEGLFRRALQLKPEDPELHEILLHLFASADEQQQHAASLDEKWREERDPHSLFDEGTQRLTTGDAEGAIDLLQRAAEGLPELEPAWYNLGMAAYRLEEWATVEQAFAQSARLNPKREEAFFFRAIALEKLERCEEAVSDLLKARELDPERALTHYYLYSCYTALGRHEEAKEARARYSVLK